VRDLEALTAEDFEPFVDQAFDVEVDGPQSTVELTLGSVGTLGPSPRGRHPFSLLFRGPDEPSFGQGTYRLRHPVFGEIELLLVPVQPWGEGREYEAIFA
jgi:hypothetical protein